MIYSFSSVCLEGGEWPQTFFPPPNPAQIQQIATVFPERRLPDSFLPMVEKCFLLTDYRSLSPAITHGQRRPISFISPSLSLSSPGQPTRQAVVWGKLVTPLCLSLADPWYKQVRHEKDEPPDHHSLGTADPEFSGGRISFKYTVPCASLTTHQASAHTWGSTTGHLKSIFPNH